MLSPTYQKDNGDALPAAGDEAADDEDQRRGGGEIE